MSEQKHIIKKQVIALELPDKENAFQIQNSMRRLYYEKILKLLDELFSEICGKDEYIFLNQLELDLGSININKFDNEFIEKLKKCFYETVIEKVKQGSIKLTGEVVSKNGKLIKSPLLLSDKKEKLKGSLTENEYFFELIKHFILKGTIPWWGDLKEKSIEEVFKTVIKEKPIEVKRFIKEISSQSEPIERIIQQFKNSAIKQLLQLLYKEQYGSIEIWKEEITPLLEKVDILKAQQIRIPQQLHVFLLRKFKKIITEKKIEQKLTIEFVWFVKEEYKIELALFDDGLIYQTKVSIGKVKSKAKSTHDDDLIHQTKASIKKAKSTHDDDLIHQTKASIEKAKSTHDDDLIHQTKASIEKAKSTHNDDLIEKEEKYSKEKQIKESAYIETKDKTGKEIFDTDKTEKIEPEQLVKEHEGEFEEIFISNAGLVLINPYLPRFFEVLKLIEGNKFIKEENKIKAVFIIQYFITGEGNTPEYELLLNKLLCGLDLTFPVPKEVELTNEIKNECNELMKSVIKNWKVLKNTTEKSFREAFLKREGKIEIKNNGFLLKVERKAHDIILDTLPWGISIVKYSWMNKPIYVEW